VIFDILDETYRPLLVSPRSLGLGRKTEKETAVRSMLRSVGMSSCALALVAAGAFAQSSTGATGANTATVQGNASEASLIFGGLVQAQFEDGDRGDSRFPATGTDRFLLRRTRLNATGKFNEDFDFRVEFDLTGSLAAATGLRAQLTDGYLNWNHYSFANIRVGQFKTPFGFEQLYGDPRLLTAERSLVNDRLTLNRQLGAQVWGDFLDKRLTYAVGTFNGNGVNASSNDNSKFLWAGRLTVAPWKDKSGSWTVGANAFTSEDTALALADLNLDSTPTTADKDGLFTGKRHGYGVDTQVETGPFSLWVEYLKVRFEPTDARPSASFDADGGYVQGGWFFIPQKFQLVLKYETFDPNKDVSNDAVSTDTVGLNYYIKGNDLKLMLDYLRTDLGGKNATQNKFILRAQVIF
jgi:phosphate-selective porin OprO/OprP